MIPSVALVWSQSSLKQGLLAERRQPENGKESKSR